MRIRDLVSGVPTWRLFAVEPITFCMSEVFLRIRDLVLGVPIWRLFAVKPITFHIAGMHQKVGRAWDCIRSYM